jgi:hypothetical protein
MYGRILELNIFDDGDRASILLKMPVTLSRWSIKLFSPSTVSSSFMAMVPVWGPIFVKAAIEQ